MPAFPQTAPTGRPAATPADEANTLGEVILSAGRRHRGTAVRFKRDGRTVQLSYGELERRVRDIARGLIALGLEPGDHVSILSSTRAEWTLADFGALCAALTVAPIYHTNSPQECAYVLGHAESRAIFCENPEQLDKIKQVRDRCSQLEHLILLEGEAEGAISLSQLCERGASVPESQVDERVHAVDPEEVATLVYTSGTTGPPKGCMLTHRNFVSTMRMYAEQLELGQEQPVIYIFLPLAHVLARVTQTVTVDVGGTLAFWGGDPKQLVAELAEVRPTHFPAVPRIYEKAYQAVLDSARAGGPLKKLVFQWALREGRRKRGLERSGQPVSRLMRRRCELADRLALSKVRDVFGGRLKLAMVGAAPIGREVLEFFDACGVLVLEGYGMTESCAAATLNTPSQVRFGTVGRPLPGTEIAIAGDGEVLMRGPHVFAGYFKDPQASNEVLEDGWLHSGDLGKVEDGYLSIVGRKKDLIITSSGKNITPANLENALRETRWVSETVVYGDRRPYLVALLTLDPDALPALAERFGVAADAAVLAVHAGVRELVQADVEAVNQRFARIEQIKRFALLDHDLTQAGGELTPTLKVKRAVVYDKYAQTFDSLYTARS